MSRQSDSHPEPESKAPKGYCPNCEYPMDPGRCPECGQEVAAERLARTPRSRQRRRTIIRIFLVTGILLAGLAINWYVSTPSLYPTFLLLRFQGDAHHWATIELARRYLSNELSATQAQQVFEQALDVSRLSVPPGPYPPRTPIPVQITCGFRLPKSLWGVVAGIRYELAARIDEHKPVGRHLLLADRLPGYQTFYTTIVQGVGSANAGSHTLTADLSITLEDVPANLKPNSASTGVLKTWKVTRSAPFTLLEGVSSPLPEIVEAPELASQIEVSVTRVPCLVPEAAGCLSIRCPASFPMLWGVVWLRTSDGDRYQPVGTVVIGGSTKATERQVSIHRAPSGFASAATVDVLITPELDMAPKADRSSGFYGAVVERRGVVVGAELPGKDDE